MTTVKIASMTDEGTTLTDGHIRAAMDALRDSPWFPTYIVPRWAWDDCVSRGIISPNDQTWIPYD
jgi:hypothetical protein